MISNTDQDILGEYDIIAQRCREIEAGIYFYIKDNIHPSHLTEGEHSVVLNYLIKGKRGTRVTPIIHYMLHYTDEDYRNGDIERDLEKHTLIDLMDAYQQVEARLTQERLSWDQVIIDTEWKYIHSFRVSKDGEITNDTGRRQYSTRKKRVLSQS